MELLNEPRVMNNVHNSVTVKQNKTIILVWTQHVSNLTTTDTDNFWGLADMLRGVYGLYNLAESLGYTFLLDYSLHPISQLLCPRPHAYSDFVHSNKDKIPFVLAPYIDYYISKTFESNDVVYFNTNCSREAFNTPISPQLRTYLQTLLQPNAEFQQYIQSQIAKLPFTNFSILHYRLGDNGLVRNLDENLEPFLQSVRNAYDPTVNTVLLTDSVSFRNAVRNTFPIFTFTEPIGHIGYHNSREQLKQSLFEFLLLSKADYILSYTIYGGLSGFTHIGHTIYDVPLIPVVN
jgi:hypothetical protein